MKKILCTILALSMIFALVAACGPADPPAPVEVAPADPAPADPAPADDPADDSADDPGDAPPPVAEVATTEPTWFEINAELPGRIAIITNTIDQNEEEFRSAEALVRKYGAQNVIHRTWPVRFAEEAEMMITIMSDLARDSRVEAIIINQAVVNTNAAIDAARAIREEMGQDIFIVSASAAEVPADVSLRVDLALDINNPGIGRPFVEQAHAMGAETIIHYSFPRHMAIPMLAARRDAMAATAEELGINFVEVAAPDPMEEGGMPATQLFISQDAPRQIAEHGPDTVLFATNCGMQIPLLAAALEYEAMYVQPCCPSPFHAFPTALGLSADQSEALINFTVQEITDATIEEVARRGLTGRFSNIIMPAPMVWTTVGFMYAVEWLNGNAPQEVGVVDMDLVHRLTGDYAYTLFGERKYFTWQELEIDGVSFPLMLVGNSPYITY